MNDKILKEALDANEPVLIMIARRKGDWNDFVNAESGYEVMYLFSAVTFCVAKRLNMTPQELLKLWLKNVGADEFEEAWQQFKEE